MMIKYNINTILFFLLILINFINININGQDNFSNKKNDLNNVNNEEQPIYFEEIIVRSNNSKVFRASGLNYNIMLRKNEAILFYMNKINEPNNNFTKKENASSTGSFTPVYLRFINANESSTLIGKDKTVKKISYYNSTKNEITKNINLYKEIEFKDIYNGVDLVFSGNKNEFNYILYVNSGDEINNILLEIDGVQNLTMDAKNNMIFEVADQQIIQSPPKVVIIENNKRVEYNCNFYIKDKNLIGLMLNK